MAYALTLGLTLGAAQGGLTLTADLRNADGTSAAGLTTTSLVEVHPASGSYQWAGTLPEGHRGYLRFMAGATFVTHVSIEPAEVETARSVWTSGERTLTQGIAAAVRESGMADWGDYTFTLTRGDRRVFTLSLGEDVTGVTFRQTAKRRLADADAAAVFTLATGAGITVTNTATGALSFTVPSSGTQGLENERVTLYSDVQGIDGSGNRRTYKRGLYQVLPEVTQATS